MNNVKLINFIFVILFFALSTLTYISDSYAENIAFQWAIGAVKSDSDGKEIIPITDNSVLRTGDRFKIYFELQEQFYLYLFYRSSTDEIMMLFPFGFEAGDSSFQITQKHFIPPDENWYQFDENVGTERFYLLASIRRLEKIETLYKKYMNSSSTRKKALAKKIMAEIRNTIKRHKPLLVAKAERPVTIGGTLRSPPLTTAEAKSGLVSIAQTVSASDFYSRIIVVEHK
ncbi:DUF4384 domain-containing protein [Desulfococcaceae bacterium HSG9]|nr:DUF4384 domain-containing protein [Desulfococcaceae bacterium HSG9]